MKSQTHMTSLMDSDKYLRKKIGTFQEIMKEPFSSLPDGKTK